MRVGLSGSSGQPKVLESMESSDWNLEVEVGQVKLRVRLFHVKYFPENTYFPEMLFSGKENIFKCLVAFQKML